MRQGLLGLLVLLFSLGSLAAPLCESVFRDEAHVQKRIESLKSNPDLELPQLLWQMQSEKKLIYRGKHKYEPGTEFLASNEFDWLATPFDKKPADVLVAFGTNSSWDIAVHKNVKSLYVVDWSPYPLLAHAYIISPLMKIAKTPQEFIILLSGRVPTPELTEGRLGDILQKSNVYSGSKKTEKLAETEAFLEYLARREEISDFDLQFLNSYFKGMAGENSAPNALGPFKGLRHPNFAKLLSFYHQRYSPDVSADHHIGKRTKSSLEEMSVFSSQKNFDKLKSLFDGDKVQYGMSSITDLGVYQAIKGKEAPGLRYSISVTNIFDCGCYNGLTMKDFSSYLHDMTRIFESNDLNPLVVFRTTNTAPPHGFYRYDLKSPADVLWLDLGIPEASSF